MAKKAAPKAKTRKPNAHYQDAQKNATAHRRPAKRRK